MTFEYTFLNLNPSLALSVEEDFLLSVEIK